MSTSPTSPPVKTRDLTVNKVLAGAGAAATSAVLGSFFGAAGTVAGAAIGSVASTVATSIYQRSLDTTQERLGARFRREHPEASTEEVEEAVEEQSGDRPPPPPPRRRWWPWVAVTVLVFAIGLGTVTALELVKGSSLTTGQSGTSVGRVLEPSSGGSASDDAPSDEETTTTTRVRDRDGTSATPTRSARPTPTETATPTTTAPPANEGGALPSVPAGSGG